MVPNNFEKLYLDPIEELDAILDHTWRMLCDHFDVDGELPDIQVLFDGTDTSLSNKAAEIIIANMLIEIVGNIGRFSPWYTKPARVFGLSTFRDVKTKCIRWILAPEAIQKWQMLITPLADSIFQNSGLIQAMLYVENLMGDTSNQDECMVASCSCLPSHTIKVRKSVFGKMEIYCNVCKKPFT